MTNNNTIDNGISFFEHSVKENKDGHQTTSKNRICFTHPKPPSQ